MARAEAAEGAESGLLPVPGSRQPAGGERGGVGAAGVHPKKWQAGVVHGQCDSRQAVQPSLDRAGVAEQGRGPLGEAGGSEVIVVGGHC